MTTNSTTHPPRPADTVEPDPVLDALRAMRRPAPAEFTQRVMAALPPARRAAPARPRELTGSWSWVAPALAGAAAAGLIMTLLPYGRNRLFPPSPERVMIQFVLHAPEAGQVDLVGDFTAWQPGRIRLEGPDATGHWSASLELPAGRYEYLFLVDGREWVTDPQAQAYRPDGFGYLNAVMNL